MSEIIIDAGGQIAGRVASRVAKMLLREESVCVVNAEKAIISGNPDSTVKLYESKIKRGDPYHGPFYPKAPDKIMERVIRGMLPYKKPRGKRAFKRLKVFISIPEELKDKDIKKFDVPELGNKFITLGKLSSRLGVKKTWQ